MNLTEKGGYFMHFYANKIQRLSFHKVKTSCCRTDMTESARFTFLKKEV